MKYIFKNLFTCQQKSTQISSTWNFYFETIDEPSKKKLC